MRLFYRFAIIGFLLTTMLLSGCYADNIGSLPKSSSPTTSESTLPPTTSSFDSTVQTTEPDPQLTEPEIVYHPEALWTPRSVDITAGYTVIETENGTYEIGRYGYYDENGNQIELAPDQKIALAVDCSGIGFPLWNIHDSDETEYPEYTDLPNEITAVITEEMFNKYFELGSSFGHFAFLEDWLEAQGFEVLKDHACHYMVSFLGTAYFKYRAVLIITTPQQLAEFKMPYPQTRIFFWGAYYEDFAPELMS